MRQRDTYTEHHAFLNQGGEFAHAARLVLAGAAAPEHAGLVVGGQVEGLEGYTVGAQDGLEARRGRDDVRRASRQRRVDVERGVHRVRHGCGGSWRRGVTGGCHVGGDS